MLEGIMHVQEVVPRKILRDDLADFLAVPVTADEVLTKADFIARIQPWLSEALIVAGYPLGEIDTRLSKAFNGKDFFNRDAEIIASDVNRVINNWVIEARTIVPGVEAIDAITLTPPIETPVGVNDRQMLKEAEQAKLVVLENPPPSTLVLKEEQRVSNEIEVPAGIVSTGEKREVTVRQELEALNEQLFDRGAYLEFTYKLHSDLREKYDAVLKSAKENLKRYSALYTPSKTEKEALQYLSSLQGQYARMQAADSETGIRRAELVNSLNRIDSHTDEGEVKNATKNYVEQVETMLAGISKLEGLIAVSVVEEKPPQAEAYRAQLELMQSEANKILATFPKDHPRYTEVQETIANHFTELTEFLAVENGGDKNILEQSSWYIARRDRVKPVLQYIKAEQDHTDFVVRKKTQVEKLASHLMSFTELSPEDEASKQSVLIDVEVMRQILNQPSNLADFIPLSGMAEATLQTEVDHFVSQKNELQGYLGNANVIVEQLRKKYTFEITAPEQRVLTDEELVIHLEGFPLGLQIAETTRLYNENWGLIKEAAGQYATAAALERRRMIESPNFKERVSSIVSRISPKKMGRAAAFGLALGASSGYEQSSQISPSEMLGGLTPLSLSQSVFNADNFSESALWAYLRNSDRSQNDIVKIDIVAPVVPTTVPELASPAVGAEEIVPGVVLPEVDTTTIIPTTAPLEIFSDKADRVPEDGDMAFLNPERNDSLPQLDTKYPIKWGDTFWDINEGQSIAGKLPVMSKINPYFKQALIDLGRDEFNKNKALMTSVGGFGKTANDLIAGQTMNLQRLNEIMERIAVEAGYLK